MFSPVTPTCEAGAGIELQEKGAGIAVKDHIGADTGKSCHFRRPGSRDVVAAPVSVLY